VGELKSDGKIYWSGGDVWEKEEALQQFFGLAFVQKLAPSDAQRELSRLNVVASDAYSGKRWRFRGVGRDGSSVKNPLRQLNEFETAIEVDNAAGEATTTSISLSIHPDGDGLKVLFNDLAGVPHACRPRDFANDSKVGELLKYMIDEFQMPTINLYDGGERVPGDHDIARYSVLTASLTKVPRVVLYWKQVRAASDRWVHGTKDVCISETLVVDQFENGVLTCHGTELDSRLRQADFQCIPRNYKFELVDNGLRVVEQSTIGQSMCFRSVPERHIVMLVEDALVPEPEAHVRSAYMLDGYYR
jgi:hypothetical protein